MSLSHRILVVDDSVNVVTDLTNVLSDDGKTVISAGNGEEGLSILSSQDEKIDLCITDLNMPVMSGFEMVEQLQAQQPDSKTPIIMLTTEIKRDARKRGKALGIAGWLIKPFENNELLTCVNTILNK